VQTAKEWNARLKQARQWLETLPKDESSAPEEREGAGAPRPQTLEERLREAVARLGYLGVRAEHLIAQSPTLTIHKVRIGALRTDALKDEVFSVDADHISSHPALLPDSAQVVVRSQSERIRMTVRARPSGDDAALVVRLRDLPVDEFASSITVNGSRVVQGGTMDVLLRGGWAGGIPGHIDLPMRVTLRDSTIRIPEAGEAMVKEFALPIGLRGPLDDLGIAIDDKALADALVKAGADALAGKVQARAQEEIDRATGKVTEKIKEKVGESVGDALGNLLQKPPK